MKIRPLYMTGLWSKELSSRNSCKVACTSPTAPKRSPLRCELLHALPKSHHGSTSILACEVTENATLHSLDTTMKNPDRPARRIPSDLGARYELRRIRVGAWEELLLPAPSSGRVELGASNRYARLEPMPRGLLTGGGTGNLG